MSGEIFKNEDWNQYYCSIYTNMLSSQWQYPFERTTLAAELNLLASALNWSTQTSKPCLRLIMAVLILGSSIL